MAASLLALAKSIYYSHLSKIPVTDLSNLICPI